MEQRNRYRSVYRDASFWGMLITQFLGVFNDNFFKQTVLLVCVELAQGDRVGNLQGIATMIFSAPFILLSGYCGFLSDLYSKRRIVVLSKVLEIVVMVLGLFAFSAGNVPALLAVLCLMGAQSALFGPSKYGILPELFSHRDLPRVNGWIMMTTFLAIILGFVTAGLVSSLIGDQMWIGAVCCIGIATAGTLTALLIRPTPVAHPDMKFHVSSLLVSRETWSVVLNDRRLLLALVASSLFWTTGGVVYPPAINDLGLLQFQLSKAATSQLAACTGLGIAVGCLIGGALSRNRFDVRLIRGGTWGMFLGLILLGLPGTTPAATLLGVRGSAAGLVWLGISAGLFNIPLQVLLQARTPAQHKGRIIGAMNLANWIGICGSGLYYHQLNQLFAVWNAPYNLMFLAAAVLLLPILLFYHPQTEELEEIQVS